MSSKLPPFADQSYRVRVRLREFTACSVFVASATDNCFYKTAVEWLEGSRRPARSKQESSSGSSASILDNRGIRASSWGGIFVRASNAWELILANLSSRSAYCETPGLRRSMQRIASVSPPSAGTRISSAGPVPTFRSGPPRTRKRLKHARLHKGRRVM